MDKVDRKYLATELDGREEEKEMELKDLLSDGDEAIMLQE